MSKLFLVPTPIGNLEDITLRAVRILRECDLVLAEDTRTSSVLLNHFGIRKPMLSHHKFNEHGSLEQVLNRLRTGESIALISDAGTPGISDPGFLLVRACIENGIPVESLPGPTAFVPALVCSGIPCDRFVFEGFLPQKKGRLTRFQFLANESRTMVFYESPFRINRTLQDFITHFGPDRKICISRELSKKFEEHLRGSCKEIFDRLAEKSLKGEIVIIVEGHQE